MQEQHFSWKDCEGTPIFVYHWLPDPGAAVKAVVQISHGMAETAQRYERLAEALTEHGFIVYANDHIGHGRTAGTPEKVGIFPKQSFNKMVEHMVELTDYIRGQHHGLPVCIFGHSMGSFLTQQYMYRYPHKANAVILSGSNGKADPLLGVGISFATWIARLRGADFRSELINGLTFGAYNKAFAPNRSTFDWLSRDTEEVDKYIADPYCGALFSAGFYRDFFIGLKDIGRHENKRKIPKDLPIYIFSGDQDPVGGSGKGVLELVRQYKELGLIVSSKLYPGGRHEMLNETNREEVTRDLLAWIHEKLTV
jgi:alpha-beta hydrolase superfamily lysophospholipase